MNLLIVESPTKATHIGHMLGSGWTVKASFGHVRDMVKTGEQAYVRPPDFHLHYEISDARRREVVNDLKRLAKGATVYLATDPDREGEAISWHLCQVLGIDPRQARRVAYQEVTETAVLAAIANPRPLNLPLVAAQEARRGLDRMVGWEVSGPLSRMVQESASAGRVQTPALRLIVERERLIRNFRPTTWYQVLAHFAGGWQAVWQDDTPAGEYFQDLAYAQALAAALPGMTLTVAKSESKPVHRAPPPPFTTSSLQMDGSRALKIGTEAVMKAAQALFDKGAITYHRTDSPNLSAEGEDLLRQAARAMNLPLVDKPRRWKAKEGAQEGHEATRPTDPSQRTAGEDATQKALYDLIWKRAMASQMPDAIYQQTSALLDAGTFQGRPARFKATGRRQTEPGWMVLYQESSDDDADGEGPEAANPVPLLNTGAQARAERGECKEKQTQPPPRFSEAGLVKALEDNGVGRPSTYASIIKVLFARNYIQKLKGKGQMLGPTPLGEKVVDALVGAGFAFADLHYTRNIEESLDAIAQGQMGYKDLLARAWADLSAQLGKMPGQTPGVPCPVPGCGGQVRRLESKFKPGQFYWACSNRDKHYFLSDLDGRPGPVMEKAAPKAPPADAKPGPACKSCKAKTSTLQTKNGHDYYRCYACRKAWWPDKDKPETLGKAWDNR